MKQIIVGECVLQNIFNQVDPDVPREAEFEATVVRALNCLYKKYRCFRFTGGFHFEDNTYEPDLALVAKDLSHWFIIEVELSTHSFDRHVLPQVRTFQYGTPLAECSRILARELGINQQNAKSFMAYVPRSVAVIANKYIDSWSLKLQAHTIPLLTVSLFRTPDGSEAIEMNGRLDVLKENVGFAKFSTIDRSLLFQKDVHLPDGRIQMTDPSGNLGLWTVVRQGLNTWVTKEQGTPNLEDQSWLQLIRSYDGTLVLRKY